MPTWAAMRDSVFSLTNRPHLIAETNAALKNAIRSLHNSGKYWRDLAVTQVMPTVEQIQTVNLSDVAPRFRGMAYLKSSVSEKFYRSVDIQDLLDEDGYARTNIFYGIGNALKIRSDSPETQYDLCYYQYPVVIVDTDVSSWLLDQYDDLVYLWAAATVLGAVGEQEIKQRLETLSAIGFADLQQNNIEIDAR